MALFNNIIQKIKQSFKSNDYSVSIKDDTVEFDSAKGKFKFNGDIEAENIGGDVDELIVNDLYVTNVMTSTNGVSTHGKLNIYDSSVVFVDSAAAGNVQIEFIDLVGQPSSKFILRPNFSNGTLELSIDSGATWKTIQTA